MDVAISSQKELLNKLEKIFAALQMLSCHYYIYFAKSKVLPNVPSRNLPFIFLRLRIPKPKLLEMNVRAN